jgi:hypothetical protein
MRLNAPSCHPLLPIGAGFRPEHRKRELAHSSIPQHLCRTMPALVAGSDRVIARTGESDWEGCRLAQLFQSQHNIALNVLEGSGHIAYAESLAAVSCINHWYGMNDIQEILERVRSGQSIEAALRAAIHSGYGQPESDVIRYLAGQYGRGRMFGG